MKFNQPRTLERFTIPASVLDNSMVDASDLRGGVMIMPSGAIPPEWHAEIYGDDFLLIVSEGHDYFTGQGQEIEIASLEWCYANYTGNLDSLADGERDYLIERFGKEAYEDYLRQLETF